MEMIERLRGILIHKTPLMAVVECGGVGYGVNVSARTGERLPNEGSEISLLTHLIVREDSLTLYGFFDVQEKELFLNMIEVNGIGPKMAQRILSSISPNDFLSLIAMENSAGLSKIKGIGKKTSEMLVLALKDKALSISAVGGENSSLSMPFAEQEAVLALHTLGVKDPGAKKAVEKAVEILGKNTDSGKLIAEALRHL
ncbi:MAG: Holliday junction branch migration protein RuvA [Fibromonadaceae bacterium]|jgi:Holliday junction DNA helicase RuvA|nr:Holliday junction branch migration protein RuvA [Fibromonadaceae bacterium]